MDKKTRKNPNDKASEESSDKTREKPNEDFSFHIRRATIEDCPAIVNLELECFDVPWSEKSINDDLAINSNAFYYVAVADYGQITNKDTNTNNGQITNKDTITNNGHDTNYVTAKNREVSNNEVIGYIGMWLVVDDAQIMNVAVSQKYRRKGVAITLLRYLCVEAKTMGAAMISLEVSGANEPAISLYENEGFRRVGLRKKYYEKIGQDAIIMLKKVEQ